MSVVVNDKIEDYLMLDNCSSIDLKKADIKCPNNDQLNSAFRIMPSAVLMHLNVSDISNYLH